MNSNALTSIWGKRYLFALIAGLLWAAAFPNLGIAGFAWIAPGLILFAAREGTKAFRIGYVAGLTFYLTSLYWLLFIPLRVAGIPVMPFVGWVSLSAYLALYPAIWAWLCWRILKFQSTSGVEGTRWNLPPTWSARNTWALSCAVIWVALEMAMARVLTGFPWNFLGVSQFKLTPLIQIASVTGVYGVSFLVVWFAAGLFCCAASLIEKPTNRRWIVEIALPGIAVAMLWAWGANRTVATVPAGESIRLALIQPSIEQNVIWDSSRNDERFADLLKLSEQALAEKADVLVWPEAAMPNFTQENMIAITNLIASRGVSMVFGADDVERSLAGNDEWNFYNASFLFGPDGGYISSYRKLRLVMFGEYIPFSDWLPFLKKLVPIGNFSRGKGPVQFKFPNSQIQTSVLICFEDVFPHYGRHYVHADTDFLLNLTNDGWFGDSSAQWQHASTALFRAVENRRPLVRCTNNGVTCWIDEFGRVRQVFKSKAGDIHDAGYLMAEIPLPPRAERSATFYNRNGDWFGWSCVAAAALMLIAARIRKKRTSNPATN